MATKTLQFFQEKCAKAMGPIARNSFQLYEARRHGLVAKSFGLLLKQAALFFLLTIVLIFAIFLMPFVGTYRNLKGNSDA